MERVIGIDLGTTNSVVAYYEQGQPVVIQNLEGGKTTPSVVFYKSREEVLVGDLAKRQVLTNPEAAIRSVKRFMGQRFSEIGRKREGIGYRLTEGPDDSLLIDVGWAQLRPEDVAAEVLRKMKKTAEDFFGEPVTQAVVTVPAYFNDNQRTATKRAAEAAGLQVARILNEPTAAALAYGVGKLGRSQKIAVFDFGGGTFDISILEIDQDVIEVKSTRGDTFLGGDNIDHTLFNDLAAQFAADTGVDLRKDPAASQRLIEAAEGLKCELSSVTESEVSIPFIAAGENGPLHLRIPFTRDRFNALIAPLMPRLEDCCKAAMVDARLLPADLDNVLLVGGSTRIPAIQNFVRDFFGRDPNRSLNPDEAVAVGACIQGSILTGALREVLLLDVTPLSLGIETAGNLFSVLIPRNSTIPTVAQKVYTTTRDNQTTVKIHVLQGERKICSENQSLGFFKLTNITEAPKDLLEITVTFQIDANGILHVSATEATSGQTKSVSIETYAQVSGDEAERVVAAAESAMEEDRRFLRKVALLNRGNDIVDSFLQIIDDQQDPPPPELTKRLREIIFRWDVAKASAQLSDVEIGFGMLEQASREVGDRLLLMRLRREADRAEEQQKTKK